MGVVNELAASTPKVPINHPGPPIGLVGFSPFHLPAMLNTQETLPSVTISNATNEFLKVDHAEDHS